MNIQKSVQLAPFTTFKIGGPAKYFTEVNSEEELLKAVNWAKEQMERLFILAGGSNVLFADAGYNGLIIKLNLSGMSVNEHVVESGAGTILSEVIMQACEAGQSGMEKMYGIPGTVGGAVHGNAGAFGTESKDILKSVRALNIKTNQARELTNAECEFAYRTSFFKQNPDWVVLSASFKLKEGEPRACKARAREILKEREKRHLQNVQAAGSFFFNPVAPKWVQELFEKDRDVKSRDNKVPAGYLIDKAGLRGKARVGGAESSAQHADYIINTGGATATDVIALAEKIKKTVKEKFEVELEEEVKIVDF